MHLQYDLYMLFALLFNVYGFVRLCNCKSMNKDEQKKNILSCVSDCF